MEEVIADNPTTDELKKDDNLLVIICSDYIEVNRKIMYEEMYKDKHATKVFLHLASEAISSDKPISINLSTESIELKMSVNTLKKTIKLLDKCGNIRIIDSKKGVLSVRLLRCGGER